MRKAEDPNDATVVFQYTVFDKRTPLLDDQGNKVRKVTGERGGGHRLTSSTMQCNAHNI